MKRILSVLALFSALSVNMLAGDDDGARFGVMAGFTSSSSNAKNVSVSSIGQYHVGLTAKFPIAFGFALQPSVLYQAKGTKLSDANIHNFRLNAKVGYVEVPVQLQWGPDLVAFKPYIFAEPFVGYGLHSKVKETETEETTKNTSFSKSGLARWEYGLGLGGGIEVWRFQITAKYYWNFGSLYSESGEMNNVGHTVKQAFKDGRNFNGITFSLVYFFK